MPDSAATLKQNQTAARDLNRMLLRTVRTDWSFPDLPPATNSDPDAKVPGMPISYRERWFGLSDDSDSESGNGDVEEEDDEENEHDSDVDHEHVKFETPDSVADYVQRSLDKRKRKRVRAEEAEMSWNRGLCFFVRRRNAWTAAISKESMQQQQQDEEEQKVAKDKEQEADKLSETSPTSTSSDPGIHTPTSTLPSPGLQAEPTDPFSPPTSPTALTQVLFPIASPLIPMNHRIRESLLSRPDQELYDRLILDSRSPLVPINLKDIIRVMVCGWKSDGNWPPRSAATASSSIVLPDTATVGRMGRRGFRSGVESVKRVLRLSSHAAPTGD